MRISVTPSRRILLQLLLVVLALEASWSATILHHGGATAISHQSFVRLSSPPAAAAAVIHQPTVRIINVSQPQQLQLSPGTMETQQQRHTPAHLTYAAHPVVHQMLPRIKPVRSISYASLLPGPRQLRRQPEGRNHIHIRTHTFAQTV
ncbi:hypothetical protein KR044_008892 [Drosophila immigrans]|nr:hypothetical protein KR044_008892 [Drosophila immigrans]